MILFASSSVNGSGFFFCHEALSIVPQGFFVIRPSATARLNALLSMYRMLLRVLLLFHVPSFSAAVMSECLTDFSGKCPILGFQKLSFVRRYSERVDGL